MRTKLWPDPDSDLPQAVENYEVYNVVLAKTRNKQIPPPPLFVFYQSKIKSKAFFGCSDKPKKGPTGAMSVCVYLSQLCVGGYSLAAVTLAGTLARAPALVPTTHWYLPSVRLERVGM